MTAEPLEDSIFNGWSGGGWSGTDVCTVTMNQAHTVIPTFTLKALPCIYSISPPSQSFGSDGGTGSIAVSASPSSCSWTVSESVDWINITSSGSGNGTVNYTAPVNPGTSSRTALITVAGRTHTVTQSPPLSAPTLLLPQNNAVMDNNCEDRSDSINWNFSWSSVSGATRYRIYVIGYSATIPVIDSIVASLTYRYSDSTGYIADSSRLGWTWRVRAGNNSGEWSTWSQRSFNVEPLNTDSPGPILY